MATIVISEATRALLDAQVSCGGFASDDEAVQFALQSMAGTRGEDYEDLDAETRADIEAGEAEHQLGLSRPFAEVRAELEAEFGLKHVDM